MMLIFLFILGCAIGSFLNVLIDRLPNNESINGRSHCDYCRKTLAWFDLVPVFSFLSTGGRCRYCHKKLSWQYPLVEILTGLIFLLIFNFQFSIFNKFSNNSIFNLDNWWHWNFIENWLLVIGYFGIVSCFIVIFFSDLKYQLISEAVQLVLFIFTISTKFQASSTKQILNSNIQILNSYDYLNFGHWNLFGIWDLGFGISNVVGFFIAGIIVMLPILLIYLSTKGRGMGFGDVELAFNMGFLLGIKGGLLAVYVGFILGAIVGVILLLLRKKGIKSRIAFGPFLVLGTIILLFFQEPIFALVAQLYGI